MQSGVRPPRSHSSKALDARLLHKHQLHWQVNTNDSGSTPLSQMMACECGARGLPKAEHSERRLASGANSALHCPPSAHARACARLQPISVPCVWAQATQAPLGAHQRHTLDAGCTWRAPAAAFANPFASSIVYTVCSVALESSTRSAACGQLRSHGSSDCPPLKRGDCSRDQQDGVRHVHV